MTFAIIIGTKADGTKCAVGDPMPLSQAKAAFPNVSGDGLKMVEIYELRQHSKRRKIGAAAEEPEKAGTVKTGRKSKKATKPKE